jgi:hypothetical protein
MAIPRAAKNPVLIYLLLSCLIFAGLACSIHAIFQVDRIGIDFYYYWHAGRVLFVEHGDPYGPDLALQNQLARYGRPALPTEDHLVFYYPLFILTPFLPFFFLPFDWAQSLWMALNILLLLNFGMLFFPQARRWLSVSLLLFYEVYFTLIIGNSALLICLVLLVVVEQLFFKARLGRRAYFLLGLGLALLIGKPQLVWLFLLLIFFFGYARKAWEILYGFASGTAAIMLLYFALAPGWLLAWINNTRLYQTEGGVTPQVMALLGVVFAAPLSRVLYFLLLLLALVISARLFWQWKQGRLTALVLIAWCAWITNLFDPSSLTPDRNVLLIPLFLWAVHQAQSRQIKLAWGIAILGTNAAFFFSLAKIFPNAVEQWALLLYTAWLAYFCWSQRTKPRPAVDWAT